MKLSRIEVNHLGSNMQQDVLCIFDLTDIYHGYKLLVNVSLSIISLLDSNQVDGVIAQRVLTEAEMRVLLPLLDAPLCCQQEVLRASSICTYEFLLQSLLSPDGRTSQEWDGLVQEQRERLNLASEQKAKRREMRSVYNTLFSLRPKLEQLGLTIRVRRTGYYICKTGT